MLNTIQTSEFSHPEHNICEILAEDVISENGYGLEYIIDEIISDKYPAQHASEDNIDWFGLYDLSL
jgi:hypothetical protein